MENLFQIESFEFDNSIIKAYNIYESNTSFFDIEFICEKKEESSSKDASENGFKKIQSQLVKFISSIIEAIRKFMSEIKEKISQKFAEHKFASQIKELRKAAKVYHNKIVYCDVWTYEKTLKKSVEKITSLINKWEKKNALKGTKVEEAEIFLKLYDKIVEENQKKLDELKQRKIEVEASKVLDWIETHYNHKGNEIGIMEYYTNELERCSKIVKGTRNKVSEYYDYNGMKNYSHGLTNVIKNSSTYVKNNISWISLYAISTLSTISAVLLRKIEIDKLTDDPKDGHGGTKEERKMAARKAYKDSESKSKKGSEILAGVAASSFTAATIAKSKSSKSDRSI